MLVTQPDKVRFIGTITRIPHGDLLGVVAEGRGQDRIVPRGSRVSRLHIHDVGELRYVCTHDADGRVWEIVEVRWSHDNSIAGKAVAKEFGLLDEEGLTEHLREEEHEDATEGWYDSPDLSRTGAEL